MEEEAKKILSQIDDFLYGATDGEALKYLNTLIAGLRDMRAGFEISYKPENIVITDKEGFTLSEATADGLAEDISKYLNEHCKGEATGWGYTIELDSIIWAK